MENPKGVSGKLKSIELSIFCYQMSLVFKSGIPLVEGMPLVTDEMTDPRLVAALKAIHAEVERGQLFHLAMSRHPIFPQYMVRMIRIGETTGTLDDVMDHLSVYYDKDDKLGRRIRTAVTYPVILIALMTAIILLLFIKILPMFDTILRSVGGEMPGVTRALMDISAFLSAYGLWVLLVVAALAALPFVLRAIPAGRMFLDANKLRLPFVKSLYQKIYTARFSLGMSLMLKSGVGSEDALELIRDVVGNVVVAGRIERCRKSLKEGMDSTEAFTSIGIFPKLFVRMLNIGFRTGGLDSIMAKLSEIYDSEVDGALSKLTSAIEPTLVIVLSLVVGVILLTVMLPLISIMSSIG
jgi:type IV pilus assembly protein PilC